MLDEVEIIPVLHKVTGAGGGQGREGVQLPDSLMDKAVLQSAGPRLETPQSPP